jgi:hypothetical protein
MNALNGVLLKMDNFAQWNRFITSNPGSHPEPGRLSGRKYFLEKQRWI